MATTKKRPRGVNPRDLTTAQAEGALKYGPQKAALSALIAQAGEQYGSDIASADVNARAAQLNAKRATPGMRAIYDESTRSLGGTGSEVDQALAQIGPAADMFKASIARERGTAANRVGTARANALSDLAVRGVQAEGGRQLALNQARAAYGKTLDQIAEQTKALGGDLGSYVTARLGAMASERAKRTTQKDVARIQTSSRERIAAQNRAAAQQRAAAKTKTGDRRTAVQRQAISDDFQKAISVARDLAADNPRAVTAKTMLAGAPPAKDAQGRTLPAIPSFGQTVASLALDMAYDGHLSPANAKKLHKLGYKVSDLTGAMSYQDWLQGRQERANSTYGWGQ